MLQSIGLQHWQIGDVTVTGFSVMAMGLCVISSAFVETNSLDFLVQLQ